MHATRIRLCGLAALPLLLLAGCGGGSPADRPNVVIVTVDTLRADHLALYGYDHDTMPAVGRWAEDAVVFDNAVSPRGLTRPAYASMLTGLDPWRHGVRHNFVKLHEDVTTLAERLRDAGYGTAGFVSNYVMVRELSGLDQGFETWDDFVDERPAQDVNHQRIAPRTLAAVLAWLRKKPPEPFFLFVHFIDPHGPYTPPEDLEKLFARDEELLLEPDQVPDIQMVDDSLDYWDYVARYDGEARRVDEAIEILLGELEERGILDDSIVIFVADHGESFGEHGIFFEHKWNLYEETNRVPLAILLPESMRRDQRKDRARTVASVTDITPTVLDLVGLPVPEDLDGRSLRPAISGEEDPARVVFLEFPNVENAPGDVPEWWSARGTRWSLIQIRDQISGKRHMQAVFDLERDPYQQYPLPPQASDPRHRDLISRLDAWYQEQRTYRLPFEPEIQHIPDEERDAFIRRRNEERGREVELTPEQIEKLRSLGYVD